MSNLAILKSINRHVKHIRAFEGGRQYGVDFATWSHCYPQTSRVFREVAEQHTGKKAAFMPANLNRSY